MKPKFSRRLLLLTFVVSFQSASAADKYWSPALTGTWDTATANWSLTSLGTVDQKWSNLDNAFFDQSGTPYTVSTSGALTAGTINISAGDITFAGSGGVKAASVTIGSGATVGGAADRLLGAGTTDLNVDGTLSLATGSSGGRLVTITGGGTISNTAGAALRLGGASNFSGNVEGSTVLILEPATSSINFSGTNNYSGDTLLRATTGTLRLSSAGALSANTFLRFGGGTNVVELANGNFSRAIGSTPGTVRFNNASDGAGNSGFAAIGADRTVALTGGLVWGSTNFNPTQFILGNANSTHKVELTSDLDLGASNRTLFSTDGAAAVEGEISGVISGAGGGLVKRGSGTILLSNANTFTGTIDLNATGNNGFLRLSSNEALGLDATVKTLTMTSSTGGAIGGIELTNNITVNNKNFNVGGRTVGPSFAFLRNLSGDNTWNGDLLIGGGGGGYSIDTLDGTLTLGGNLQNNVSGGTRTFVFRNNGDSIISGTIKNNGTGLTGIDKGGSGTMTITGTGNTATGGITVTGGTLSLGDGTTGKDGNLATGNNISITSAGNLTFNRFAGSSYGGAISGDGSVTKLGAGTQTLTGTNSWNGTTLISKGTLEAKKTTQLALGSGDVSVSNGATLLITDHAGGGQLAYTNKLTLSGTGDGGSGALSFYNSANFSMTGNIDLAADTTINNNSANQTTPITFTGVISGVGGLTLQGSSAGSGTPYYILSAANTYGSGNQVTNLTNTGSNVTRLELSTSTNVLPTGTTLTFGGTGATDLLLDGISQTVAGLAETGAAAHRIVGNNAANATLTINNAAANSFGGAIGGAGANENNIGLSKTNSGTLTLSGNNTYSGGTLVSAGTLYVNGDLANSAVTVNGGKFGGTSTNIGAGVTVGTNGTLAPGNSIGTLGVSAADIAGALEIQYGNGSIDLLNVAGLLNLNAATAFFSKDPSATALDGVTPYTFATYGSLTGTFATANAPAGYKIDYAFDGGNNIALVPIPEPAAALLGSFGLLVMLRRRRA